MSTEEIIARLNDVADLIDAKPERAAEYANFLRVTAARIERENEPNERVPLEQHKAKLVIFLKDRGPATRREIASATGIPMGSLSHLLIEDDFIKVSHGLWDLTSKQ